LLVITLLYSTLWATVVSDGSLLKPGVSEKEVDAVARATTHEARLLPRRDPACVDRSKK